MPDDETIAAARPKTWGDDGEFPPEPSSRMLDACDDPLGAFSREAATTDYDPDDDEALALGLIH
ncbi:MAG: hypothetical protein LC798_03000 [Chloroflexi bacterium]|nr:hypothetical protein [Chloroflexota bacterium]